MKIQSSVAVILFTLFTIGCNNSTSTEAQANTLGIELNEGHKWEVNSEMAPFITDAEQLLNDFTGNDYSALAQQLKDKNNALIQSCTMNGKSHDELHKWLLPHLQLVDALAKAENSDAAEETVSKLKASFEIYHTYFQ